MRIQEAYVFWLSFPVINVSSVCKIQLSRGSRKKIKRNFEEPMTDPSLKKYSNYLARYFDMKFLHFSGKKELEEKLTSIEKKIYDFLEMYIDEMEHNWEEKSEMFEDDCQALADIVELGVDKIRPRFEAMFKFKKKQDSKKKEENQQKIIQDRLYIIRDQQKQDLAKHFGDSKKVQDMFLAQYEAEIKNLEKDKESTQSNQKIATENLAGRISANPCITTAKKVKLLNKMGIETPSMAYWKMVRCGPYLLFNRQANTAGGHSVSADFYPWPSMPGDNNPEIPPKASTEPSALSQPSSQAALLDSTRASESLEDSSVVPQSSHLLQQQCWGNADAWDGQDSKITLGKKRGVKGIAVIMRMQFAG
eukprot:TRINITY_DN45044_c0_g1_i1.p1 TRINITY_DN45044_c0_g1~~TRINITY_DN45044_c0_g1_i1.p1  ORF type:complete len:387 (+),score=28.80 TRINITY_DN45044_c0_g1_i1:73-1161(+)